MPPQVIFGSAGLDADLTVILGLGSEAAQTKVAPSPRRLSSSRASRSAPLSRKQVAPQSRQASTADYSQKEPAPQPLQAPLASPQQGLFARFRRAQLSSRPPDARSARSRRTTDADFVSERAVGPLSGQAFPAPAQEPDASFPQREPVRARLLRGPTVTMAASVVLILAVGTAVMMHQAPVQRGGQSKSLPISFKARQHGVDPRASPPAVEQVASADLIRADQIARGKDTNRGGELMPAVASIAAVKSSSMLASKPPPPARSAPVRLAQARPARRAQGSLQSRVVSSSSLESAEVATAYAAVPVAQSLRSITVEASGAVATVSAAPSGRAELAGSSRPARVDVLPIQGQAVVPAPRVRRDGVDAIRALRRQ